MSITWKEFKDNVEAQGVTDGMEIDYLDFNSWEGPPEVDIENNMIVVY